MVTCDEPTLSNLSIASIDISIAELDTSSLRPIITWTGNAYPYKLIFISLHDGTFSLLPFSMWIISTD